MSTFTYDLEKHFTASDRERLRELANSQKKTIGDLIEVTLKRAIFTPISAPKPRIRKA